MELAVLHRIGRLLDLNQLGHPSQCLACLQNVQFPEKGLVFDYYVDEAQCMMVPWDDKVEKFQYIPGKRPCVSVRGCCLALASGSLRCCWPSQELGLVGHPGRMGDPPFGG